jgi:anhydro-N-acetylmuramic acid kinase
MDGIDVALLETDGDTALRAGPWMSRPYPAGLREALLGLDPAAPDLAGYEERVTRAHIDAVREFCAAQPIDPATLDCVGFHGQTIKHEPQLGRTWQLGDGARMAHELGCVVINRFRDEDLRCGGQGAPLAPAYHRALTRAHGLAQPVAILNIGGVSNVTLVAGEDIHAFDCGPYSGRAQHTGARRGGPGVGRRCHRGPGVCLLGGARVKGPAVELAYYDRGASAYARRRPALADRSLEGWQSVLISGGSRGFYSISMELCSIRRPTWAGP